MGLMFTKQLYSRKLVKENNKDFVFVFGDNLSRIGTGGQATIRGLKNTIGVATKISPSDCFTESNWKKYKEAIDTDIDLVEQALQLKLYKSVVVPRDFIGTGLANLQLEAPGLLHYITFRFTILMNLYGVDEDVL